MNCSCLSQSNKKQSYTKEGLLNVVDHEEKNWHLYPIRECSMNCQCDEESCTNRLVQHGCKFELEKFKTEHKGFGLRASQLICAGSFVIAYLGDLFNKIL